jgi:hypothetical protein
VEESTSPLINELSSLFLEAPLPSTATTPTGRVRDNMLFLELTLMIDAIRLVSVLISTEDSATSFNNFKNSTGKEQFAVAASKQSGEGVYCFPIDVSQLGLGDEVKEGSKATLQIAFDGGDGNLYQVKD